MAPRLPVFRTIGELCDRADRMGRRRRYVHGRIVIYDPNDAAVRAILPPGNMYTQLSEALSDSYVRALRLEETDGDA